jgi:hypothetical protein
MRIFTFSRFILVLIFSLLIVVVIFGKFYYDDTFCQRFMSILLREIFCDVFATLFIYLFFGNTVHYYYFLLYLFVHPIHFKHKNLHTGEHDASRAHLSSISSTAAAHQPTVESLQTYGEIHSRGYQPIVFSILLSCAVF